MPIIKAKICEIDIPLSEKKDYVLQNISMENYQVNGVYDCMTIISDNCIETEERRRKEWEDHRLKMLISNQVRK